MFKTKRIFIFFLFLASIAIIFLIGEIVARKFYGDGFLSLVDPQLDHRRRPNINIERQWGSGESFRLITNSLGWRDEVPYRRIKKIIDKEKRIIFLGDSFTEGIGYNQEDIFSGIVKRLLKEKGFDYEILNGGMASYSPLLEYVRLKKFLDKGYKTDIIILLPDFSDVQDDVLYNLKYIFDNSNEPLRLKTIQHRYSLICNLLNSSCLIRTLAKFVKKFYDTKIKIWHKQNIFSKRALTKQEDTTKSAKAQSREVITSANLFDLNLAEQSKLRANWEIHQPSLLGWAKDGLRFLEANMERIKKICDENNILLIIVIYPWPQHLYAEEDPIYYKILQDYFQELYAARELFYGTRPFTTPSIYETAIVSFCAKHSIDVINFYPIFRERKNWHDLFIYNDVHFNKKGHRFIGEEIVERLIRKIE